MQRNGTNEDGRRTVQRVIWRLLAFAALAHRAGAMPLPVRFALLWILRNAEARIRPIVMAMARERGYAFVLPPVLVTGTGWTPAAAERLALCYRMLARAFGDLRLGESRATTAWQAASVTAALLRRMAKALCPSRAAPRLAARFSLGSGLAPDTS